MKILLTAMAMLFITSVSAQSPDHKAVQKTIETFFDGFHQQDSTIINQVVSKGIVMQTIAKDSLKNDYVSTQEFSGFLKNIVSIPETTKFKEVIKDYLIKIDGPMANAWTPYEFWLNDTFHHCGVNSFQLFKEGQHWKIIYIIDTRRTQGCK